MKPKPSNLSESFAWIRTKFTKRQYKDALTHLNACLKEIAGYEYSFLMSKASALFCLDKWSELSKLLSYLYQHYPNDAEVLYQIGEFFFGQGRWHEALTVLSKSESLLKRKDHSHFIEGLFYTKISCLMAIGREKDAIRFAKTVLQKYPRSSTIKAELRKIKEAEYRLPEPWISQKVRGITL